VTLCVAAALAVVGLGFIHVITGITSPFGLPCDIVFRESFGYREAFVDARAIQSLPYSAARLRHPLGIAALQRGGYLPSGVEFEAAMMAEQQESLAQWQAEFQEALGRPQVCWQERLQGSGQSSEMYPEDARACNRRGIASARQGEFQAALAEFGRAIHRNPAYADAFYNRALVYVAIGNVGQAAADLGAVIEMRPGFVEGYVRRGRLYVTMNEPDKALADFAKAIEIEPACAEAWFHRSLIHYSRGDREKARADVRTLRSLGVSVPSGFLQALGKTSGTEGADTSRPADF
jgi:tetratricopeptide (TPR) repeat protein